MAATFCLMTGCVGESVRCVGDCAYFGQEPPACAADLFAPGILSTDLHDDGAPVFTPGQDEVYFRTGGPDRFSIFFMEGEGRAWSRLREAPFAGEGNHGRIAIAPDGGRIYFSSDRPAPGREEGRTDFDLWYVERDGDVWGTPVQLGPEVNTDLDELDVSVAADLTLYFHREGTGAAVDDVLFARLDSGRYAQAIPLGPPVNTARIEAAPYVSPDEDFLIFTSAARAGSRGGLDLYVSFRRADGSWSEPRNLGDGVNTRYDEKFASISPDGRFLFFSSDRPRSSAHFPGETLFPFRSQAERAAYFNRPKLRPYFTDIFWVGTEVIGDSLGSTCTESAGGP